MEQSLIFLGLQIVNLWNIWRWGRCYNSRRCVKIQKIQDSTTGKIKIPKFCGLSITPLPTIALLCDELFQFGMFIWTASFAVMLYHLYTFYSLWPERFHDFHLFHSSMAKRTCRMLPHVWTETAVTSSRKSYGLSTSWKKKSSYIWKLLWAVTACKIS